MSEAFIGEIRMFGGNYAPVDWHKCDGSLLSINSYKALFALIGTLYGGDGVNTFALPDLRSRTPMGMGQGLGLTNRVLGQRLGSEVVTLSVEQLPAHQHTFSATTANASTSVPANAMFASQTDGDQIYVAAAGNQPAVLDSATVVNNGGGGAHDNIMPSLGVTYIMCLNGIFPSRN